MFFHRSNFLFSQDYYLKQNSADVANRAQELQQRLLQKAALNIPPADVIPACAPSAQSGTGLLLKEVKTTSGEDCSSKLGPQHFTSNTSHTQPTTPIKASNDDTNQQLQGTPGAQAAPAVSMQAVLAAAAAANAAGQNALASMPMQLEPSQIVDAKIVAMKGMLSHSLLMYIWTIYR